jgi:hypothetical protein
MGEPFTWRRKLVLIMNDPSDYNVVEVGFRVGFSFFSFSIDVVKISAFSSTLSPGWSFWINGTMEALRELFLMMKSLFWSSRALI